MTSSLMPAEAEVGKWSLGASPGLQSSTPNRDIFIAASESSLDAFFVFDSVRGAEGQIVDFPVAFLNRNAEKMIAHTQEQVLGKLLCDVVPVNAKAGFFDLYVKVAETGTPLLDEFAIDEPGIAASWIERQVVRLGDGIAISARDISARKDVEFRLKLLTERLSLANESAGIAVWDWDLQSNEITCDAAMYRIWGMERQTSRFDDWAALVHKEDLPLVVANLKAAIAEKIHNRTEFRIVRGDGEVRYISAAQGPLLGADGNVIRVIGVNSDISDRKRAELQLADSVAFTRSVLTCSPFCTIVTDPAGVIVAINQACERLLGYKEAELAGKTPLLIHDLAEVAARAVELSVELGTTVAADMSVFVVKPLAGVFDDGEWTYVRKDGSRIPVRLTISSLRDSRGGIIGFMGIADDITDRREKQQLIQAALKEKNVLLGEIHHRVKNNLQVVHSLLDLQCGQVDDPVVLATLRDSQSRIRSMALIHQTLYQSNDFAEVGFDAFLNSLAPTLIQSYVENPERITLTMHAANVHLPIGSAIPSGLMVNELMANCMKHAFPDGRTGKIDIEFIREEDGTLQLSVSDNGVGIPEDLDLTQTDSLGLQLVFLLTDQLGGTMTVRRSDPTAFVLRFKLEQTPAIHDRRKRE